MTFKIFNLGLKWPHLHGAYVLRVCNNLGSTVSTYFLYDTNDVTEQGCLATEVTTKHAMCVNTKHVKL